MLHIKRLYTFIYQTFLPVFAMTFGICLFIFTIQFLWQHIEKLVGKGLETEVLLEFFLYAILALIPRVLPLAILLASLISFGNMGERLELLAVKAAGVSLLKVMQPLIILITLISIGSFVFQNKVAPSLNVKLNSLFYSIQRKSPELNIPEGAFYNDLSNIKSGYSIYVKEKDLKTHMLRGVIIYDSSSGGFQNMAVDVCDSAMMVVAASKDYLTLKMFHGQRFSNYNTGKSTHGTSSKDFVPHYTESFDKKEIVIPFKGDFDRIDESSYDDNQLSKDLKQLQLSIDSMGFKLDSLNVIDRKTVVNQSFVHHRTMPSYTDSVNVEARVNNENYARALDFDSILSTYSQTQYTGLISQATSDARNTSSTGILYQHFEIPKPILQKKIRMHEVYWHKMFTLPFACLVFFFIGAPLGSIIRKGGLGIPAIISVILFIVYYIFDNVGTKMARDGVLTAMQGVWLSTGLLFPLGVFLTYKSTKESALFNAEVYGRYLRKILRIKSDPNRNAIKEPEVSKILPVSALNVGRSIVEDFRSQENNVLKDIVHNYHAYGYDRQKQDVALSILKERETYFFDVRVSNFDYNYSSKLLTYFKNNALISINAFVIGIVLLTLSAINKDSEVLSWLTIATAVTYVILYIRTAIYMKDFFQSVDVKFKWTKSLLMYVLCFLFYPIFYFELEKRMKRNLEEIKDIRF